MFSPGGSSCWAEAHRALGSGDSGLPNSLYLKGPAGRVCLEHMALVEVDIGMTGQTFCPEKQSQTLSVCQGT